jgi:hypothetical protein
MEQPLDLNIALTPSPSGSPSDALATITMRYDSQGLFHTGDILTNPLSSEEEENLRWYLEEYWKWPFEQFRERAEEVELLLPLLGKRLYHEAFRSTGAQISGRSAS